MEYDLYVNNNYWATYNIQANTDTYAVHICNENNYNISKFYNHFAPEEEQLLSASAMYETLQFTRSEEHYDRFELFDRRVVITKEGLERKEKFNPVVDMPDSFDRFDILDIRF